MALTLKEIRENTVSARKLMERARKEKFALGAFNLDNQETLKAVARAALAKKSPVILEVSHAEIQSIGIQNIRDMVDNYKNELGIEIYLNLDHSPTIEAAIEGIESGFEFIQLDILSNNPDVSEEDIINQTKYIVEYARLTGAIVESEPHYFAEKGSRFNYEEVKKTFSSPDYVRNFIEDSGIDIFGVAVGNLHAEYNLPKTLDLELLAGIRNVVDCGLSLHGGSGTPEHYFKDAIELGVCKINVNSDIQIEFRDALEKVLKKNPDEISMAGLMDEVVAAVQKVVEEKIDLFGSSGKAV